MVFNLHDRIAQWFIDAGVPIGKTGSESHDRIERIFQDLITGARTEDQVKASIARISGMLTDEQRAQPIWGVGSVPGSREAVADPSTIISEPPPIVQSGTPGASSSVLGDTASAIVSGMLREYGLGYTQEQIDTWVGWVSDDPNNISLVEEEIRISDEFKDRFPGLQARLDNNYAAISVAEYLDLEESYRRTFRNAELPAHFWDEPHEIAEFIGMDVSPSEMEARVSKGVVAAQNAPQEVKDALSEFYGVGSSVGALAAYYLDPDKGLEAITREFESATLAGVSKQTGFGQVSKDQAEELQSLGVTEGQARQGFSGLEQSQELLTANVGEVGSDSLSRQQQLDATFKQDADLLERIRKQRERRTAAFSGSNSGATIGQSGVGGLKSASDT